MLTYCKTLINPSNDCSGNGTCDQLNSDEKTMFCSCNKNYDPDFACHECIGGY